MEELAEWSTTAVNLPEHADNTIHTDVGARAAGFAGALVAGVTVYGYLTHVAANAWGVEWLGGGEATVRFVRPVLDGDRVDCSVVGGDDPTVPPAMATIEASVAGDIRARCAVQRTAAPFPSQSGDRLEPIDVELDDTWSDYGLRSGDDCDLYARHRLIHPTAWLRLANRFCHEQLVVGPWIHVASRVVHHSTAPIGSRAHAEATVVRRFDSRAGRRAVLDVRIAVDGRPVASVEHEAIIELT